MFPQIQKHISGFNGDPSNITAFGESAGSICLSTLLHTQPSTPLFTRAVFMSGDPMVRRPRDMTWQNNHYLSIAHTLKLTRLSPHANKQYFFNVPAIDLAEALPAFSHWSPVIDGKLIRGEITMGMLRDGKGRPEWCKEVLVGDTEHDVGPLSSFYEDAANRSRERSSRIDYCLIPPHYSVYTLRWRIHSTLTRPRKCFTHTICTENLIKRGCIRDSWISVLT